MARLLLGVSGGIAAYKALETARLAVKARTRGAGGPDRRRAPSSSAAPRLRRSPGRPSCETSSSPTRCAARYPGDPAPERTPISHLALVQRADLYLIAPASANTIAKLAHGQADNLLTTAALAARCPVVVAPAMNNRMYPAPGDAGRTSSCSPRAGVTVIEPGEGELASHGEHGVGRLAEPAQLLAICEALLARAERRAGPLLGRRVLVTAGGTREPIDSVRYIGNRSSGRMGFALAEEAARRGAQVTVVAANVALDPPPGVRLDRRRRPPPSSRGLRAGVRRLRRPAHGRRRRRLPAPRRRRHKLKKDRGVPTDRARADRGRARRARRRAGARSRSWSASRPSTVSGRSPTGAASSSASTSTRSWSTTSRSPGSASTPPTTRSRSCSPAGRARHVAKTGKEHVAGAVLDEVETLLAGKERDDRAIRAHPDGAARV